MRRTPLAAGELAEALSGLDGWSVVDGRLHRRFEFTDFIAAFAFMTAVALQAEKLDHHPDWSNAYRTVTIDLVTHSAGGITALDVELARRIDAAAR
jgi:4a-hydroxytetrahydrobiopterin dehydratase